MSMECPNKKTHSIIRVSPEIHHEAKIAACQNLLTLQEWVEHVIINELKKIKQKN